MSLLRAFALSLPAVLLAACGAKQPPADDARVVRTTTITTDEGNSRSDYSGEVRSRYESSVGFRISGRIAQRLVEVGTRVHRNQPLARLDASDAELNVSAARAALASAKSEYAQIDLDFQRAQRLFERRFISQAEFDRDRQSSRSKDLAAIALVIRTASAAALCYVARTTREKRECGHVRALQTRTGGHGGGEHGG